MNAARVCTCIRATDPRLVAVPDPECGHPTTTPAALMLGRLITLTTGLLLIALGITAADGTALPAAAWITGTALICRLAYVAATPREQS